MSYTHHCLPVEKKELCIFNCVLPTKGKHFYSSSESEEEEESHKKFNIKIKPLQSKDILKNAATVDELKASIGNIALSPSPVVSGFLCQAWVRLGELCPAHTQKAEKKLLKWKAAYSYHFMNSISLKQLILALESYTHLILEFLCFLK